MGHRVVFTPSGLQGEVADGTTALEAARQLGVDLDSVCGGRGICGRCQVVPGAGAFPKWAMTIGADHVSAPGSIENDYRGKRPLGEGHRLGCGVEIRGDIVFDVPPESQIHKQVVRKSVDLAGLIIDPAFTLHYLELDPELDLDPERDRDPEPDLESAAAGSTKPIETQSVDLTTRIAQQLTADWGIGPVTFHPSTLPALHQAAGDGSLTVALRATAVPPPLEPAVESHAPTTALPSTGSAPPAGPVTASYDAAAVVGVWPNFVDRVVGIAIDIGSTTVAGHLCDLTSGEVLASAGRMNPQIRFGEDLMSRVSYVMMNPGGDVELTRAIRSALDELVTELLDQADCDRSRLLDIVLVGNPIMHHLTLGIDPTPLGQAPFTLATSTAVSTRAVDLGIDAPWASVYVAPCIAGHVGADTAAAILSEGPHRSGTIQLLVDVGTNAEIVLGSADRLFAASSPTGPAFEGAQISAGQRATAGAIERVRIDRETGEPRFRVIGCEHWSDEPDFDPATGGSGVTGICGSGIIEVIAELYLCGLIDQQGVIRGEGTERTDRIVPDGRTYSYRLTDRISISQADVRAIQLAKAALRAGSDLLMEHAGISEVDEIRLAGAFGAHIDPLHAMVLGLIPDCPLDRVRAVGNAAGSGAVRALLSRSQRAEVERVVADVTKIETATEPRFQELFVAALAFPHDNAPTPHLSAAVDLPVPGPGREASNGTGERPRRRRRSRAATTGR